MKKYPILGSHVSMNAQNDYLLGAVQTALDDGANTFMIYTGPPQNAIRKPTSAFKIPEMQAVIAKNNLDPKDLVVHAPYIINISNPINSNTWKFGVDFLQKEIQRCSEIGIEILVLHPGAFTQGCVQDALNKLIEGLDIVTSGPETVKIALETMSGKGTEVGTTFEQLAYVLTRVKNPEKIGICLDTCHLNDAGYDLRNWPQIKEEMKNHFGFEKVLVFHLNDSKNPLNSHKDRHENIGYGTIGFEILSEILWDEDFKEVPKILETPYVGNQPPYKAEIADLRNKKFTDPFKNEHQ